MDEEPEKLSFDYPSDTSVLHKVLFSILGMEARLAVLGRYQALTLSRLESRPVEEIAAEMEKQFTEMQGQLLAKLLGEWGGDKETLSRIFPATPSK